MARGARAAQPGGHRAHRRARRRGRAARLPGDRHRAQRRRRAGRRGLAHPARRRRLAPAGARLPRPAARRHRPQDLLPRLHGGRTGGADRGARRPTRWRSTTSARSPLRVPREVKALVVDGAPSPTRLRDEAWFVEAALGSSASPVRPTLIDAEALASADLRAFDVVLLLNVRTRGGAGRRPRGLRPGRRRPLPLHGRPGRPRRLQPRAGGAAAAAAPPRQDRRRARRRAGPPGWPASTRPTRPWPSSPARRARGWSAPASSATC